MVNLLRLMLLPFSILRKWMFIHLSSCSELYLYSMLSVDDASRLTVPLGMYISGDEPVDEV